METFIYTIAVQTALVGASTHLAKKQYEVKNIWSSIAVLGSFANYVLIVWAAFACSEWWLPVLAYVAGLILYVAIPPFKAVERICSVLLPVVLFFTAHLIAQ